ncbi:MAG: hypothetical protein F9K46_00630 [Anaerolineae bacterium]|nr:MAG: hypothetical protein F9K46_00630 [Anaerolineae bacterium]
MKIALEDILKLIDEMDKRQQRLFASDCAEHVLPYFEKVYPNDFRPRTTIEVVRRFANGLASQEELQASAGEAEGAAWDAALDETPQKGLTPFEIEASASSAATAETTAWATQEGGDREAAKFTVKCALEVVVIAKVGSIIADQIWVAGYDGIQADLAAAFEQAENAEKAWQLMKAREYLAGL